MQPVKIDNNESDWPVERLHQVKSEHELWVTETLSETIDHVKLAKQTTVTSIVDSAVELCNLENWENWTSFALSPDPIWEEMRPNKIFDFRRKVVGAIWHEEFEELKRATITLSVFLNKAAQTYLENAELNGDAYYPFKFYKAVPDNPTYHRDLEKYEQWIEECYLLIQQSAKAANWFADIVRRDINPMFFAEKGKFLIMEGPFEDLSYRTRLLEFSQEERSRMPDAFYENI